MSQITEATTMGISIIEFETEGGAGARSKQEVMATNGVGNDSKHFTATVRVEGMTCG